MALIQVNVTSECLKRVVPIQVILPVETAEPPYKTLYLLHGVLGNYTDWVSGTCIQRWAEEKHVAVVMPSGDNSFYLDREDTCNLYGTYIGEELVRLTRRMFPLSYKRKDTFLAGLSMGGYGALRNGLKYNETFGYLAGLSSALFQDEMNTWTNDTPKFYRRRDFAEGLFGDLDKVMEGDKSPLWLAGRLIEEGKKLPEIYLACGTEDSLLSANRRFKKAMEDLGAELTYEEGPGGHEWDFWNRYIKRVLDWLPL